MERRKKYKYGNINGAKFWDCANIQCDWNDDIRLFFFIQVWKKGINYILTLIKVETAWILLVLRRMDEANDATLKPIAQEV